MRMRILLAAAFVLGAVLGTSPLRAQQNEVTINGVHYVPYLGYVPQSSVGPSVEGVLYYSTTSHAFRYYNGTADALVGPGQSLETTSTPQFARLGIGVAAGSTAKLTLLGGGIIAPSADSTAALIFTKADAATAVLTLDTTNSKLILPASGTITPTSGTMSLGSSNTTISTTGAINSVTGFSAGSGFGVSSAGSGGVTHWVSDAVLGWNNSTAAITTAAFGTFDTGFCRNAAGVVEVNTGTCGTFAALKTSRYDAVGTVAVGVANVGANSCGTSAASIAGNDNIGAFTVGATSGTQCRIAFVVAAPTRRHCTFNDETTTIAIRSTYVDTTHTDALGAFVAGDVVTYHCMSR